MSRIIKIATFSINSQSYLTMPGDKSPIDCMIESLRKNIAQVLPDHPDLIVLPECCDLPSDMSVEQTRAYYSTRKTEVLDFIRETARENRCYIAYAAVRDMPDGTRRNSCYMIGRNGETVGIYDKNYVVVNETSNYGIIPAEDITVFECDFGRVGALICFDLNFEELRHKYREAKPDLMLFCSNFGGGLMRSFFAFDTRCYFVSSCGCGCPGEIITPLGNSIASTSNYYNYTVKEINLDYAVCHLDFNWSKIRAAKEKYQSALTLHDLGYIGVVMLSCESDRITVHDIIKEFDIELADDYFVRSRAHKENTASPKNV